MCEFMFPFLCKSSKSVMSFTPTAPLSGGVGGEGTASFHRPEARPGGGQIWLPEPR